MPDPRFEKFREITLGEKTLNKAIEEVQNTDPRPSDTPERSATPAVEPAAAEAPGKSEKAARDSKRLVSFYIDKELFQCLGQIKALSGIKYETLYNEAVKDLIEKYRGMGYHI